MFSNSLKVVVTSGLFEALNCVLLMVQMQSFFFNNILLEKRGATAIEKNTDFHFPTGHALILSPQRGIRSCPKGNKEIYSSLLEVLVDIKWY